MPKRSARASGVDPLLDRTLVSSAEGALPVHTRVAVHLAGNWEPGLVTQTWSSLNGSGRPVILYKIQFDNGKEQEMDLSLQDAKLMTSHSADTPRIQRKASYTEPRGNPGAQIRGLVPRIWDPGKHPTLNRVKHRGGPRGAPDA